MDILITRRWFTRKSTISEVTINGVHECYFLEDVDRGLAQSMSLKETMARKVHGQTAIGIGRYEAVLSYSNRFKRMLVLLLNVIGFAGIRTHSGNGPDDSDGCQLTGTDRPLGKPNFVSDSRAALSRLQPKIEKALKKEKVYYDIRRDEAAWTEFVYGNPDLFT